MVYVYYYPPINTLLLFICIYCARPKLADNSKYKGMRGDIRLEFIVLTITPMFDINANLHCIFMNIKLAKLELGIDDHRDFGLCALQICDRQTDRQTSFDSM